MEDGKVLALKPVRRDSRRRPRPNGDGHVRKTRRRIAPVEEQRLGARQVEQKHGNHPYPVAVVPGARVAEVHLDLVRDSRTKRAQPVPQLGRVEKLPVRSPAGLPTSRLSTARRFRPPRRRRTWLRRPRRRRRGSNPGRTNARSPSEPGASPPRTANTNPRQPPSRSVYPGRRRCRPDVVLADVTAKPGHRRRLPQRGLDLPDPEGGTRRSPPRGRSVARRSSPCRLPPTLGATPPRGGGRQEMIRRATQQPRDGDGELVRPSRVRGAPAGARAPRASPPSDGAVRHRTRGEVEPRVPAARARTRRRASSPVHSWPTHPEEAGGRRPGRATHRAVVRVRVRARASGGRRVRLGRRVEDVEHVRRARRRGRRGRLPSTRRRRRAESPSPPRIPRSRTPGHRASRPRVRWRRRWRRRFWRAAVGGRG